MSTMAKRIKEKRLEYHLTMEELGEKIGVNKSSISKWERGNTGNIKRSYIAKMAKIFHCSPVWLMALEGIDNVSLTYEADGKEPVKLMVDHDPIVGQTSKIVEIYDLVLSIKPENYDIAIKLLKTLV